MSHAGTEGSEVWVGSCRCSSDGSFGRAAVLGCLNTSGRFWSAHSVIVSLLLGLGWSSWSATLWSRVHPRSHLCLHHPHAWPSSQQLQRLRCIFRIFLRTKWRGHLSFTKALWSHILNEWVLCLFCFSFPFERVGTVLCSWFKEIGTNTLTGWDGTELLTFAVWWIFSLKEYFPATESGTLIMIFPECLVLLGRIVFTLWLCSWLRYVPSFTSTAMPL